MQMQKRKKTYYFELLFDYEDSLALFGRFVNRFCEKKLFWRKLVLKWMILGDKLNKGLKKQLYVARNLNKFGVFARQSGRKMR